MKKRQVFGLVVAGLLASFVSSAVAQSGAAYSSTAVGVIKKTLPAGKYSFISFPLDTEKEANYFCDTPLFNLPNNSVVSIWNATTCTWDSATKLPRGGWGSFSNRVILDGQPVFVYNNGTTPYNAIFSGTVPTNASIQVAIPSSGNQTVANPYPVAFKWGSSSLASNLSANSTVYVYDSDTGWAQRTKLARGGWGEWVDREIGPAEGIWLSVAGTSTNYWTVSKPYSWPQ